MYVFDNYYQIFYSLKSEQVIYKSSIFATSIDHIVFKPFFPKNQESNRLNIF